MGHKLIDRAEIDDPTYIIPPEPSYHEQSGDPQSDRVKAWKKHESILSGARRNVLANSKMDLVALGMVDPPNEDWEEDSYYFWEGFLDAAKAFTMQARSTAWSISHDPHAPYGESPLIIYHHNLTARSYGDREERCIRMADVWAVQSDIDNMKKALINFGFDKIDFSFRTIWDE